MCTSDYNQIEFSTPRPPTCHFPSRPPSVVCSDICPSFPSCLRLFISYFWSFFYLACCVWRNSCLWHTSCAGNFPRRNPKPADFPRGVKVLTAPEVAVLHCCFVCFVLFFHPWCFYRNLPVASATEALLEEITLAIQMVYEISFQNDTVNLPPRHPVMYLSVQHQ